MKIKSAKTYLIGAFIIPVLFSGAAIATGNSAGSTEKAEAYGVDDRGIIVRNSYNECWRTGYWTPAMAIFECDPDLVKKPEKVAAAPAPAPAPAPQPPKKVTFSADALFDFDSAQLRPTGVQKLNEFVNGLSGLQYDQITATGHADRIGNPDYNQRLSVRRAESVKNHLVSRGIDANRIYANGVGSTTSVTGDSCKGLGGQALKNCYLPDRRVDIEVSGIK